MASEVLISGLNEFSNGLKGMVVKSDVAARKIVVEGIGIINETAKQEFRAYPGGKTVSQLSGRIYYKGAPQFPASPPNPTNRSGKLRSSIRSFGGAQSLGEGRWMAEGGTRTPYGPYVEYGTSRARKFPFMELGIKDGSDRVAALAERYWGEAAG